MSDKPRQATKAVHAGSRPDPATGSMTTPIHRTTAFAFDSVDEMAETYAGRRERYIYTRYTNPSLEEAEEKLVALEEAPPDARAFVFSSGMAAITAALLSSVASGERIVAQAELYGGTSGLMTRVLSRFGIEARFVEAERLATRDDAGIEAALREAGGGKARLVYLETPANPTLRLVDIEAVARAAHRLGCLVCADNTFATPVNQRPMTLGADIVVHSATKYLAGHSDLTAGFVLAGASTVQKVRELRTEMGAVLDPSAGWLLSRSMKTLALRVAAQNANAMEVSRHLAAHPRVARVNHPGLPDHPGHEIAARQMSGFGGMLSFELKPGKESAARAAARAVESLRLIRLLPTLGGVESNAMVPAVSSHRSLSPEERARVGVGDGLIRLSLGIEDPRDLIRDLDQALG